jgi:hypothetical protein
MLSFAGTPPSRLTRTAGRLSGNAKAAPTASLAATAGIWSLVASPNTDPTQDNLLFGVACPSASDCWAAGYLYNGSHSQTLIEHWDGSSWSIVPSPNSSTSESNFLLGLTCTSATDCWAVGHHDSGGVATFVTLIEHYDGTSWSVVSSPNSTAGGDNELRSVACASAMDCWAVGYYSVGNPALPTGALVYQTLIAHWDGTSWTVVTSPNSSPVENNSLEDVSCTSATNCWAVGGYATGVSAGVAMIEHYDGTSWSIVSSPSPSGNGYILGGVACTSATDCWASGSYATTVQQSLKEHYDGASWNVVDSANTDPNQSNFPFSITCQSATDCWAVGWYFDYPGGDVLTLINQYDGTSWSVVDSPNPPPNNAGQHVDFLTAVTCSSTTDCWAVGYYFNVNGVPQTITEHYTLPQPPIPTSVISRKTHGTAGTFDINLPLVGTPGIECRSGGASGDYQVVVTFAVPVTFTSATMTSGTGTVSNTSGNGTTEVTVNLTGVTNAQTIAITLLSVNDGTSTGNVVIPMGVLIGDTSANGFVNSSDISQTKAQSGTATNLDNFRTDVTVNGLINSSDISTVKSKSGTALP